MVRFELIMGVENPLRVERIENDWKMYQRYPQITSRGKWHRLYVRDDQDKRVIELHRRGDLQSKNAIFVMHGTPGSRLGPHVSDQFLRNRRLQLISHNRPGYGESTPKPGRDVAYTAKEVAAMAEAFGLEQFALMGRSGGVAHALACAALLPELVTGASAIVGYAPRNLADGYARASAANRDSYTATSREELMKMYEPRRRALLVDASAHIKWLGFYASNIMGFERPDQDAQGDMRPEDIAILKDERLRGLTALSHQDSVHVRVDGWPDDIIAGTQLPWPDLSKIACPVHIVGCREDPWSTVDQSEILHATIPSSELTIHENASHFYSLAVQADEIRWITRATQQ